MTKKTSVLAASLLVLLIALLVATVVQAQPNDYEITRWSVHAGGGSHSDATSGYTLTGSVGQADVGPEAEGGTYSVVGGFWPSGITQIFFDIFLPLVLR